TPDGVDREVVRDAPGEAQQAVRSAVRLEAGCDLPEPEQRLLEHSLHVRLGREAREAAPERGLGAREPPGEGVAVAERDGRSRLVEVQRHAIQLRRSTAIECPSTSRMSDAG